MNSEREAGDLAGKARAVSSMLASDHDRDAVAGLLNEAFAEGRLTAGEHGERVRAAYTARTWAELTQLTTDLPAPAGDPGERPAAVLENVDRCLLCVLLCLCPPAAIAWLLAALRRSRPDRGGAAGARPGGRFCWAADRRSPAPCGQRSGRRADSHSGSGGRPVMPVADRLSHGAGFPPVAGCGLEEVAAARAGRRSLGRGGGHAEDR